MHQNYVLFEGDELLVRIREWESSKQVVPVKLPIDIVYEDEDLLVINKASRLYSAVSTVWTGTHQGLPLWQSIWSVQQS